MFFVAVDFLVFFFFSECFLPVLQGFKGFTRSEKSLMFSRFFFGLFSKKNQRKKKRTRWGFYEFTIFRDEPYLF